MRFKRSVPTILSVIASLGVVGTAVMAVLETPEAEKRLADAKKDRLTKTETFFVVAPVYLPAVGIGVGTIACIFGANAMNKKQQASLISALALADRSYREHKNKVIQLLGEDAEKEIEEEIAKDHLKGAEDVVLYDEEYLFYDSYSQRYFNAKPKDVREAEYHLNRNFAIRGYAPINEYYEFLGIDKIDGGDDIGWTPAAYDFYGYAFIDFDHKKCTMDDGLECYIISYPFGPHSIWDEDSW